MKHSRQAAGWVALWAVGLGLLATGCQPPGPVYQDPVTISGHGFRVGDMATVVFSGTVEQIPTHSERIKEDGTITLNLIGPVRAAGKTPGQLQREIRHLYVPKYYRDLTVTVVAPARTFSVGGEVRSPGSKEYTGEMDIVQAIQAAGDFTEFANKRKVALTRANGHRQTVDVLKIIDDPSLTVPVYPGDTIRVPRKLF